MIIKFWGTRGSLPRAMDHHAFLEILRSLAIAAQDQGIQTLDEFIETADIGGLLNPVSYGGNTSCSEISHRGQSCFVDLGSGLREAGTQAVQQGRKEFHFFLTHMHWDHIMGMPFFIPIHSPGIRITIHHVHKNAPDFVRINFNGVNFPLKWNDLPSEIEFKQMKLYETVRLHDFEVTPFALDHPGGSFGYRFEAGGKSLAIGVDGEYKRLSQSDLGKDLKFYQDLDLLVFDSQYEMHELAFRFDWGHCSPSIGVDLALREGVRNLVFTHHDPWADENKLRRMYKNAEDHLKQQLPNYQDLWEQRQQPGGPHIRTAYDGLEVDLDRLT